MINVDVPTKWDIIPIHTSDIGNFQMCRRYWNWSSPTRTNLRRRVDINGINFPLWFGSGIHYCMEMYYHPVLQRDPVESFQTWFEYQWNGGIVEEEWLERTYDIHPVKIVTTTREPQQFPGGGHDDFDDYVPEPLWKIKGLKDIHPDPNHEEFMEHKELGINMMKFYREWAPSRNDFEIVSAESTFSVPLVDVRDRTKMLKWIDWREDSPNYGKELEVHARGKRDVVVRDLSTGHYGIRDYKTAARIDEDYFLKLENDPQCLTYLWATQMEGRNYDFPYKHVDFVDYEAIWKAYPMPVQTLKDGISPSLNRQTQTCTAEQFSAYISESGLTQWYDADDKAQAFYAYLVESSDKRFVNRHREFYNQTMILSRGVEIATVALDMLDSPRIYKNATGSKRCTRCQFRIPCLATDDGSDWVDIIENNYEVNRGR